MAGKSFKQLQNELKRTEVKVAKLKKDLKAGEAALAKLTKEAESAYKKEAATPKAKVKAKDNLIKAK